MGCQMVCFRSSVDSLQAQSDCSRVKCSPDLSWSAALIYDFFFFFFLVAAELSLCKKDTSSSALPLTFPLIT